MAGPCKLAKKSCAIYAVIALTDINRQIAIQLVVLCFGRVMMIMGGLMMCTDAWD